MQTVGKIRSVCFVSSHVGMEGNELADPAAKSASERPEQPISINHTDCRSVISNALVEWWIQPEL